LYRPLIIVNSYFDIFIVNKKNGLADNKNMNKNHKNRWLSKYFELLAGFLGLLLLGSCSGVIAAGGHGGEVVVVSGKKEAHHKLGIPPGHLPPPGSCRIWVPGRPPGRQQKSGSCAELSHRVPKGAWLVHRDADNPDDIEVFVYDQKRPSVVVSVRYFEASTGDFIRDGRPDKR